MYHLSVNCESEIEVKKSRFIAILIRIESEVEAKEKLAEIRKKHPNASHYCYAFICGSVVRSNDDGEPSGTAGIPILNCLKQKELDNVLAVVVRYFGGTLLGTAGLFKAYQQATLDCIQKAELTLPKEVMIFSLTVSYDFINKIENLIQSDGEILNRIYQEDITYLFQCEEDISSEILRITSGKYKPVFLRNEIREITVK